VLSPFIKAGDVDYLLSFEQTETLRHLHCLKEDGIVFSSTFELSTSSVNTRLEKDMPESKTELIKKSGKKTFIIDPEENKSPDFDISKMMNIVMLAIYAEFRGYSHEEMMQIVRESVPEKFVSGNLKAYEKGISIAKSQLAAV
jgi:indolepyruvate ferredoxin oxidoreductase beta subunit